MTKPRPFTFDDFNARPVPPGAEPKSVVSPSEADLEAARLEGTKEGRRLAMETIAADEARFLAEIAERLADCEEQFNRILSVSQENLIATTRVFLDAFCGALASAREIGASVDLLRRLLDHSDDRRPARLVISAASLERLAPRLQSAIENAGAADFVTLDSDPALAPGDSRIEWRGGEARRTRAEIEAAVAALINSFTQVEEPRT